MKDPALAICSAGARGVWMDVLCLMFESPRRGYLITNGRPWTLEQVAVALRGDWQENLVYLKELVHNGVMKRAPREPKCPLKSEAFYSKRLLEDERSRSVWKAQKQRQRAEKKRSLSTQLSTRSSSSSSSSSSIQNITTKAEEDTAAAFSAIGFEKPFGHREFQDVFLSHWAGRIGDEWVTQIMEHTIQDCQTHNIKVPPQFYEAKRDVETRENAQVNNRRAPL